MGEGGYGSQPVQAEAGGGEGNQEVCAREQRKRRLEQMGRVTKRVPLNARRPP